MKTRFVLTILTSWSLLQAASTEASIINGMNWADDVTEYTAAIQNYGGILLDESTKWWLTGLPDADVDGNGYAWDAVDTDAVAGWRSNAPDEYIVMNWTAGIPDVSGDDLVIRRYGGPSASADVFASRDGFSYRQIGTIAGGVPGYFQEEALDLAGMFETPVHYVKVVRASNGPQTGMFFDSFAAVVPEPVSLVLHVTAGFILLRRRGLKQIVPKRNRL
jgi:hypothetical protein